MAKKRYYRKRRYSKPKRRFGRRKERGMLKSKQKNMLIGAGAMLGLVLFAPDVINKLTSALGYSIVSMKSGG